MVQHPPNEEGPHNKGTAFLLWLSCVFGVCGVHRFYLGKPVTGLIWLFTFGLFGVGQLVDLFRIPALVRQANEPYARLPSPALPPLLPPPDLEVLLAQAAERRGGRLTIHQAVVETGRPFKEVEEALDRMLKAGYIDVGNDEKTGVVTYTFGA